MGEKRPSTQTSSLRGLWSLYHWSQILNKHLKGSTLHRCLWFSTSSMAWIYLICAFLIHPLIFFIFDVCNFLGISNYETVCNIFKSQAKSWLLNFIVHLVKEWSLQKGDAVERELINLKNKEKNMNNTSLPSQPFEVSLNNSVMWKTTIGSLEWKFLLPILFLLYIVLLLPIIVNKIFKKLYIVNNLFDSKKFFCN